MQGEPGRGTQSGMAAFGVECVVFARFGSGVTSAVAASTASRGVSGLSAVGAAEGSGEAGSSYTCIVLIVGAGVGTVAEGGGGAAAVGRAGAEAKLSGSGSGALRPLKRRQPTRNDSTTSPATPNKPQIRDAFEDAAEPTRTTWAVC